MKSFLAALSSLVFSLALSSQASAQTVYKVELNDLPVDGALVTVEIVQEGESFKAVQSVGNYVFGTSTPKITFTDKLLGSGLDCQTASDATTDSISCVKDLMPVDGNRIEITISCVEATQACTVTRTISGRDWQTGAVTTKTETILANAKKVD